MEKRNEKTEKTTKRAEKDMKRTEFAQEYNFNNEKQDLRKSDKQKLPLIKTLRLCLKLCHPLKRVNLNFSINSNTLLSIC